MSKVNWENEKEIVKELIESGVPYERIGKKYGVTGASVKKAAKKLGLNLISRRRINPTENFNKRQKTIHRCLFCGKEFEHRAGNKNMFCSNKCQQDYLHSEYIERWKRGEENGLNGEYGISKHIRRYLFEKNNCKCELCGWGEENHFTGNVPLEVHHKDGDYTNNKEENLQLLCPNCHSLTETFKSHNKNGRNGRGKYYKK